MANQFNLECTESMKLCRACCLNPLITGNTEKCNKIGYGFCERLRKLDSAIADFKKWQVDLRTEKMHKEVKEQFAERKAEEDKKLAPIEAASEKDSEKISNIESQIVQNHNDFEDSENPFFIF